MSGNLREALKGKLSEEEMKQLRAFDLIGDIAVVKIPDGLLPKKHIIGQALLQVHSHVKTVLNQTAPVKGEFRTRDIEVIAGEPKATTVYPENGCLLKVDLAKAYFSPRLATERLRIARQVKLGEVVTNLFAGVGSYSIVIARHSQPEKVYSIDKNPAAFDLMVENIRVNRVGYSVIPFLADARDIVKHQLLHAADRVLMPLPELGRDFLQVAFEALKPDGGVIHFYDIGNEPDVFGPSADFAQRAAAERGFSVKVLEQRKIRSYATRCYHVALDLSVMPG
jgi:tRNA (guanine37-N1)-methyltransferase